MVEADLIREYGIDLVEEFDDIGCRRMWVLLNGLPPDAAVWRVEGRQWTQQDEFLALIAERSDAWGLMNARLHLNKKQQKYLPKEALQIMRPGEQTDKRDRVIKDPEAIKKFFG